MRNRIIAFLLVMLVLASAVVALNSVVTGRAVVSFGVPAESLSAWQRFAYSAQLLWYDGLLSEPAGQQAERRAFRVEPGEPAGLVAERLEQSGLIRSAAAFRAYLVYSGYDTSLQAGDYRLSPDMSGLEIAMKMQDATPEEVTLYVLPGWRMEEIAASLPTSGLTMSPENFLQAAGSPLVRADFLPAGADAEGFLFPGAYTLPRRVPAQELVRLMVNNFGLYVTPEVRGALARRGLSVYEGVTLASIVQREAVLDEEKPIIASVFLNRIQAGMPLQSDATVQYALGYDDEARTWWTNPLSRADLQWESPYNTYVHPGLPPGPIDNPELSALEAVAYPADTTYYYFRARCDGSGAHLFAETFEAHMGNACP